jgi:hypothetical protein
MGPPQRDQPALDRLLPVLDAGCCAQALGRDRTDGGQRILDAMMQFTKDQLLQLVRGLEALSRPFR